MDWGRYKCSLIIRYTGRAVIDWGSNDKDRLVCLLRDLSPKCPEAPRCTNLIVVNYDRFFLNFSGNFDVLGFNRAQSRFGGNMIDLYLNFISDVWREIVFFLFYFSRFVDRNGWRGYCWKVTYALIQKQHLIEQQEYYYPIFFNLMDFHFVTKGCFFLEFMFVIV